MPRNRAQSPFRASKYRAVRTNGYASKREAKRAWELKLLRDQGAISNLNEQVTYTLLPACEGYTRPLRYIADFTYLDTEGVPHCEDSKGFRTDVYKLKKRLMWQLLGIKVEEV